MQSYTPYCITKIIIKHQGLTYNEAGVCVGLLCVTFFLAKESLYGEQSDPEHKMKHNAMEIEVLVKNANNLMGKT